MWGMDEKQRSRWFVPWRWGWREARLVAEVWLLSYLISFAVLINIPIKSSHVAWFVRIYYRPLFWIF
jgi:hypothetical protein